MEYNKKDRVYRFTVKSWQVISSGFFGIRYRVLFDFIGTSVGFSQIWGVPKLVEEHGIYFLMMYGLVLFTFANSASTLQAYMSQYTRQHSVYSYKFVPIAKGLGYSSLIYSFVFYAMNTQIAIFSVVYLLRSFARPLPWTLCDVGEFTSNVTHLNCTFTVDNCTDSRSCQYVTVFYWFGIAGVNPLDQSTSFGTFNTDMFIYSFGVWVLTYFALFHTPKATFVLAAVFSPLSYLCLIGLSLYILTVKGSLSGLLSLLDFTRYHTFLNPLLWAEAAARALYAMGAEMTFLSGIYRNTAYSLQSDLELTKVACVLYIIAIIASSFVVSAKGVIYEKYPLKQKLLGPGWLFVAYSETLGLIGSQVISILCFFIFMNMCVSQSSILVNSLISNVFILFPSLRNHRLKVGIGYVICSFLLTFPLLMQNGMVLLYLADHFILNAAVIQMVSFKLLILVHCYGIGLFCEDVTFMTSHYPWRFYRYLWLVGGYVLVFLNIGWAFFVYLEKPFEDQTIILGIVGVCIIISPTIYFAISSVWEAYQYGDLKRCVRPDSYYLTPGMNAGLRRDQFVIKRKIL